MILAVGWAYPAIMGLALLVAAALARVTQARLPLDRAEKIGLGLGAFCGAMLGAKLPFVLSEWPSPAGLGVWFGDGKTIVMGLVGGYLGVEVAKWALDVRIKTGDGFAVPVAAAVGIGRVACFSAGCCYGTPTALLWGVVFPVDDLPRHPTQLYEAAFHLAAALLLFALWRREALAGQLIKLYIVSYLAYRFVSEWIRPEPKMWLGLTGYQWAALVLLPVFAALWIRDARQARRLAMDNPCRTIGDAQRAG